MSRREELLHRLAAGQCTREEAAELLELLQHDRTPLPPALLAEIWAQLEQVPPLSEEQSLALLDKTLAKLEAPASESAPRRLAVAMRYRRWLAAAASILLLLGAATWWWLSPTAPLVYHTAAGEQLQLALPDGSHVTLNANSTLTFQPAWADEITRQVWLSGEAYFEVTREPQRGRKFQVITTDLTVEVLGTVFNVNTRDETTEVFLAEGSVQVALPAGGQTLALQPGELMTYSRRTQTARKAQLADAAPADWKDGTITFQDEPLRVLLRKFEEIYGLSARVNVDSVLDRQYTLSVPVDSLELAYELLRELTGLEMDKRGDTLIIE